MTLKRTMTKRTMEMPFEKARITLDMEHWELDKEMAPGKYNHKDPRVVARGHQWSLGVGGRPDSANAEETDSGEIIGVRTRVGNGLSRPVASSPPFLLRLL